MSEGPKHLSADIYMNLPTAGVSKEPMPHYAKGGKVEKVMHEFKHGQLHSGSDKGPQVTNRKQAIAIALSEARKAGQYAGGGEVNGPGTGTSDSVPIAASNGEYVIPADVASYLGTKFFDDLVKHTQMEMKTGEPGGGSDNPFEEMAQNDMGEMEPGGMPSRPPRRA